MRRIPVILIWILLALAFVLCLPFVRAEAVEPPPAAIVDYSQFTPATVEKILQGLRAKLLIADERLGAYQRDSAMFQRSIEKLTQDLGNVRIANDALTRATAKLQTDIDAMRDWGIEQQTARHKAEQQVFETKELLRIAQGRAYRREWFIGLLVGLLVLGQSRRIFLGVPWFIHAGVFAAATSAGVYLVHLFR